MSRMYRMSSERVEGQFKPVIRVNCRGCGVSHAISMTKDRVFPPEVVEKKLRQAGWSVGSNESRDYCPACTNKKEAPNLKIVQSPPAPLTTPSLSPSELPPRVMGRDDRRIIFEKLNEVYLDEKRGYDTGWSDHRVSADLGVPRKWVETIRVENFGDNAASDETMQFLAEARAVLDEAKAIMERNDAAIQAFNDRLNKLASTASDIKKAVGIK